MSYLRQQRALFAVVGVAAGAAVFVDTKARHHALIPRLPDCACTFKRARCQAAMAGAGAPTRAA
jgi:hypothetical protein